MNLTSVKDKLPASFVMAFLHGILRGTVVHQRGARRRDGQYTKRRPIDARRRKHLRNIQKMSRVKNRARG